MLLAFFYGERVQVFVNPAAVVFLAFKGARLFSVRYPIGCEHMAINRFRDLFLDPRLRFYAELTCFLCVCVEKREGLLFCR